MKILITGLHGFVGFNLVKALSPRHQIYCLDIVSPEKEGVLSTFQWADLESNEIPEVDVIIHLAGKAHDTKNYTEATVYFDVNTGLTKKIFDHFLRSGARKFIFFSSVKAVADKVIGDILTEDVLPAPIGPYAESKLAAEEYIRQNFNFQEQEVTKNNEPKTEGKICLDVSGEQKKVYILRPSMIHGPGNKGNLNLLYKVVSKGIPWPLGSFDNKRSFTSIDNLKFVISQLIEKDIPSGVYNMADDEALSTNELITVMSNAMNRKPRIWHLPKGIMTTLAKIGTSLHFPLNQSRLQKLTENYVVSNEKIKKALGIDAMPVDAREGLKKTVESFTE